MKWGDQGNDIDIYNLHREVPCPSGRRWSLSWALKDKWERGTSQMQNELGTEVNKSTKNFRDTWKGTGNETGRSPRYLEGYSRVNLTCEAIGCHWRIQTSRWHERLSFLQTHLVAVEVKRKEALNLTERNFNNTELLMLKQRKYVRMKQKKWLESYLERKTCWLISCEGLGKMAPAGKSST